MKLVTIYQVATHEKFLVELLDDDLTLDALRNVVQDRGTLDPWGGLKEVSFAPAFHKLVFKNSLLKGGYLPIACLRESKEYVHIVPTEVNPSVHFNVFVKVCSLVAATHFRSRGRPLRIALKYTVFDIRQHLRNSRLSFLHCRN